MPPLQRRRRQVEDEDSEEETRHPRQRRSREASNEDDESENDAVDAAVSAEDQLAKKLVRYALACEFSRTPIRRDGIKERVLGDQGRAFRKVFELAQQQLRAVWGMELQELAVREKFTMAEKPLKSGSQAKTSSGVFVLSTTLPSRYRAPAIITPSKAPSIEAEASYTGFYTMIITIILASGGELSEQKLRRHLNRLNAEANVASERTEDVLKRMQMQGYVVRKVQKNAATQAQDGSEDVTWLVGPRGLEEVGVDGAAGMVRAVYGEQADADLEKKIGVTFGIQPVEDADGDVDMSQAPEAGPSH
ncbi:MAGE family protein [Colletotrichum graminicola M1.001]|uniref:MAGE family protein n=1 Tax=Colletotrichum graminicola (strain M1.001 / M2 / FGSC 10212) TaxID=645133 RepID=E3Q730_COLGM|nr:MAGE family protein [Colletotrichum graminicola M1.001]EFQ26668.1 MAGE family protein [Colletotrichum graminicola M1.001]